MSGIAAIVPFVLAMGALGIINETTGKKVLFAIGIGKIFGGAGLAATGTWGTGGTLIGFGIMNMIMANTQKFPFGTLH